MFTWRRIYRHHRENQRERPAFEVSRRGHTCDFQQAASRNAGVCGGGPRAELRCAWSPGLQPPHPLPPPLILQRNFQLLREPVVTKAGDGGDTFPTQSLAGLPRWGCITCLLIPTGKLEPLVARLMGATTATRVGDGADCLFFGGNAGGGLKQIKNSHQTNSPNKTL